MEDWQARAAGGKLVTAHSRQTIVQQEANETLGTWVKHLDFVRRYLNKLVAAIYETSLSSTKKLCPYFQMGR